ncbi:MAG: isopentenyl-diphosphate Delta-isomerase [Alphaproteobacteria bacterium]|nr:isopentenyl-diphosphate Delta-isomerase [Alphaproteobacteria bacterium]
MTREAQGARYSAQPPGNFRVIDEDEQVVLCDGQGQPLGLAGKLDAHRRGVLHLAISVFVFDSQGRMLLQRRQMTKYHSQGQWANACCSHPRDGETPLVCALRRLQEEMGFTCALTPLFTLLYRADVGAGLSEHEYVHAFAGRHDGPVQPDAAEVSEYRWLTTAQLQSEIARQPERFAPWLKIYLKERSRELSAPV